MNIEYITLISTIIGTISVITTLLFLILELRRNVSQYKSANLINRDNQYYDFTNYWSKEENLKVVMKGRENYSSLNELEKFKFENYIENRVRMFSFSVNSSRVSDSLMFHRNRINEFFQFDGSLECYKDLLNRNIIPYVWDDVIQQGIKGNS
tara:strand:- start:1044 stop:1499 length:456 start_codon:yes stop_codon:yes gene_type:complete